MQALRVSLQEARPPHETRQMTLVPLHPHTSTGLSHIELKEETVPGFNGLLPKSPTRH